MSEDGCARMRWNGRRKEGFWAKDENLWIVGLSVMILLLLKGLVRILGKQIFWIVRRKFYSYDIYFLIESFI